MEGTLLVFYTYYVFSVVSLFSFSWGTGGLRQASGPLPFQSEKP